MRVLRQAHSRMAVLLSEAGYPAMAAACLEEMRGLAGLTDRDAAGIASRLREAKAAAAGRKASANHYKMLGLPQTCSAEEVRCASCNRSLPSVTACCNVILGTMSVFSECHECNDRTLCQAMRPVLLFS